MNESSAWTADDAAELYHLDRWGLGYFQVDPEGFVVACPGAHTSQSIRIHEVIGTLERQGIFPPLLVRFPGIIRHRVAEINRSFTDSINVFGYRGRYRLVYPVKVNQHREVIQAAIKPNGHLQAGLEAGSKAELLAAIALGDNEVPVVCNGSKDRAIVEMALRATGLGRNVTMVIEKPAEVELIAGLADELGIAPRLGVRVKLSSRVSGTHWNESTGLRSKFGLTIPELLSTVARLNELGLEKNLHLLHFHPGSQINNVRKIKKALIEATRVFAQLVQTGIPLDTIDVGGGLAVDYTGRRNRQPSSMNYTLREYTNDVVYYIGEVCDEANIPHPDIWSESGRAAVAHHSILVVPVLGTSHSGSELLPVEKADIDTSMTPLRHLMETRADLNVQNLLESLHDTQGALEVALQMFETGHMTLQQRGLAERIARENCLLINSLLQHASFVAPELQTLGSQLAETYYGNFSVFQALPDSWAIGQIFPVMPIHRLQEKPTRFGVLGDLTCDSDGKIDSFIGDQTQQKWMPLHDLNEEPYLLGIFLAGAYQEALADDHNLMGKFHVVSVEAPENIDVISSGSTVQDVLQHVHHDCGEILEVISNLVREKRSCGEMTIEQARETVDCFRKATLKYTYLEQNQMADAKVKQALP